MARVSVIFKVYPKDGETAKVTDALKNKLHAAGMQEEDIGFGIKVVKVLFTFDDKEGGSSKIEDEIRKLDGVSEVEVEEESLI